MNVVAEGERTAFPRTRRVGHERPGTGDVFSSVVSAAAVRGWSLDSAVRLAASFVKACIARSEELDIPIANGVCFEGLVGNKMPLRYLIEMVMDRIAASKVYKGKDYTDACAWEYFERGRDFVVMHPRTKYQLEYLLTMLKEQGEERTFAFIRALLARERAKEQAVRRKRMGHVIREIRERGRVL